MPRKKPEPPQQEAKPIHLPLHAVLKQGELHVSITLTAGAARALAQALDQVAFEIETSQNLNGKGQHAQ